MLGIALIVGLLFAVGLIFKNMQPETQPKKETGLSATEETPINNEIKPDKKEDSQKNNTTSNDEIPEVIKIELPSHTGPGNEYVDEVYKIFSPDDINATASLSSQAASQLCVKTLNEPNDSVINRISPYFSDPQKWLTTNGGTEVIEATCTIEGITPYSINTKEKTITHRAYGVRNIIYSSEADKPNNERIIKVKDIEYYFTIGKVNDKWVIIK